MSHDFDKLFKHQYGKRQEMQPGECLWQSLIISRQTPEACSPAETALHHPTTRQQHEPSFRFREFDHFQADTVPLSFLSSRLARIALVNKSKFNRLAGYFLHLLRQLSDLCAVLFVGRWTTKANKLPSVSTAICVLLPLRRFAPSYVARAPDSGVD